MKLVIYSFCLFIHNIFSVLFFTFWCPISAFIFVEFKIPVVCVFILKIIFILIAVAYFTIAERKIMASIQRRRGPNVAGGPFGILQPLADGLKLFLKEIVLPGRINIFLYLLAPILIFALSLMGWFLIPFNAEIVSYVIKTNIAVNVLTDSLNKNILSSFLWTYPIVKTISVYNTEFSILFILAISSLNVYGIILAGWASRSKYAFLGSLRSAAQMISYEVSIGLTILPVIILSQSFNFVDIVILQSNVIWFCCPLLPCAIIFSISMLAETNRAPFDLPEAEAELVAGYNVEYSGMLFALFFLGEYSSMLLMAAVGVILFFGGWTFPFLLLPKNLSWIFPVIFAAKLVIFCFFYIVVRATFPRYRYNQLMDIGWKIFLPLSLAFVFLSLCLFTFFFVSPFYDKINYENYIFLYNLRTKISMILADYFVREAIKEILYTKELAGIKNVIVFLDNKYN